MDKKIKVNPALGVMVKMLVNSSRSLSDLKIAAKKVSQSKQLDSKASSIIADNVTKAWMLINDSIAIANNVKNYVK